MDIMVFPDIEQQSGGPHEIYPFEGAYIVHDIHKKTWTERYRDAGEFEFIGPLYGEMSRELPIGSLVSHIDSQEVMIVENREVVESKNENDLQLKITGRSFETYLENRIVGQDLFRTNTGEFWPGPGYAPPYVYVEENSFKNQLPYNYSSNGYFTVNGDIRTPANRHPASRAVHLIRQVVFFNTPVLLDYTAIDFPPNMTIPPNNFDKIPWLTPVNVHVQEVTDWDKWNVPNPTYPGEEGYSLSFGNEVFTVDHTNVYEAVLGILDEGGLGIKSHRPGLSQPFMYGPYDLPVHFEEGFKRTLALVIYHGNDRRKEITFSYAGGDISEADYLQSNKSYKTSVFIKNSDGWVSMTRGKDYAVGPNGEKLPDGTPFVPYPLIPGYDYGAGLHVPPRATEYWKGYSQRTTVEDFELPDEYYTYASVDEIFHMRAQQLLKHADNRKTAIVSAKMQNQPSTQFGNIYFRRNYDTGDLVTVVGSNGEKRTMMITEHVEIEDENGEFSMPTLAEPSWGEEIY